MGKVVEPGEEVVGDTERPWRNTRQYGDKKIPFLTPDARASRGGRAIAHYSPTSVGIFLIYPIGVALFYFAVRTHRIRKQELIDLHKDPEYHTIYTEQELETIMKL